ncbi:FUSC family protein, partial [Streptomyces sp. OfavH-34-F]|nr:FUSC family protein [Streptomyces sp. OfavH-34-F]
DPEASHDARLAAACWRVESAVEALTAPERPARATPATLPAHPAGTEPALAHLHSLERALTELAAPLHSPPGAPLVTA